MRRLCGIVIMMAVVLALAAPAAAEGPADGGFGWSWSSVVERLSGWAEGVWHAFAGSETDGEEGGGDGEVMVVPSDPNQSTTEPTPDPGTEAAPEFDPNG